ncbi:MAG: CBS domain-containing protein [Nitrospira sp.]|nr:CBS domain-containing protein [Nitrospira sp.]MCP9442928.1 CBS domain-containing protein [Nitrospira sp.]
MPILVAINGIVQAHAPTPVGPRYAPSHLAKTQDHSGRNPSMSDDQAVSAAQRAYSQQAHQESQPRPAVIARDLMTSPVFTLSSDSTLNDAWAVMTQKRFRHIPITSLDGTLVGMVSERDLLAHAPELIVGLPSPQGERLQLAEIMITRVISATVTTDLRDIARIMLDEQISAVPILDGHRHPIGIVSSRDLLRGIANHGPLELWT